MEKQRNLFVGAIFFGALFMVSSAFAYNRQAPDTNYFNPHTKEISGIAVLVSKEDIASIVIQETEDWRGDISILPKIVSFINDNSSYWPNSEISSFETPRENQGHWFGRVIPKTQGLVVGADPNSPQSLEEIKSLLRAVGPAAMLGSDEIEKLIADSSL